MKKFVFTLAALIISVVTVLADNKADDIVGNYEATSDGKLSKVKIFKTGNTYTGQIYWVEEPKDANGNIKTDAKNPDASLRSTPMSEVILIKGVKFNGKDEWNGGTIYDPTKGKVYKVEITLSADKKTLNVRGKLGPFGRTVKWPRITK